MSAPRYDSTVTLGHVLTIISIIFSAMGAVYIAGTKQEAVLQQTTAVTKRQDTLEIRVEKLQTEFQTQYVLKDVDNEYRERVKQELGEIKSEIQAINVKIGLPKPTTTRYWR